MSKLNHDPFNYETIKAALLNDESPFPPDLIYCLSDLVETDLKQMAEIWHDVDVKRRRSLLEDMENLSEADTVLDFDPIAKMCLADADPVARATAIRLLWQAEEEKLVPVFIKLLNEDPESIVRSAAATALGLFVYLGELGDIKESLAKLVVDTLIRVHLDATDPLIRRRALESLGYASHPEIPDFIRQAYQSNDEDWLQSSLFAMGRSLNNVWTRQVLAMFEHPDNMVRVEAIRAAGELEIDDARDLLMDMLEEGIEDEEIYYASIWALSKIGGEGVRSLIEIAISEAEDEEEVAFMEEALENLDFTEQIDRFDLINLEEDDFSDWFEGDDDDLDDWGDVED